MDISTGVVATDQGFGKSRRGRPDLRKDIGDGGPDSSDVWGRRHGC